MDRLKLLEALGRELELADAVLANRPGHAGTITITLDVGIGGIEDGGVSDLTVVVDRLARHDDPFEATATFTRRVRLPE